MTRTIVGWVLMLACAVAVMGAARADQAKPAAAPAAAPVVVLETAKGTIEIQLAPADAPKSVAHVLALVRRNFYRGLRFHRVTAMLVQAGDPMSRDMSREAYWGSGGSGAFIGVAENAPRRTHVRGTVALAHAGEAKGDAKYSDSQFYIMKAPSPSLDGNYTIIGRVTVGMAVVDRLARTDLLKTVFVKGEGAK